VSEELIARTWIGRTRAADADAYTEYLQRTGVTTAAATPGNRGVQVLRRIDGDCAEFLFISYWESREVIRAFAGDDVERARYFPEDEQYLLELAEHVTHYEVVIREAPGAR
jgi:heme-degrading monooxygenase HmoA